MGKDNAPLIVTLDNKILFFNRTNYQNYKNETAAEIV